MVINGHFNQKSATPTFGVTKNLKFATFAYHGMRFARNLKLMKCQFLLFIFKTQRPLSHRFVMLKLVLIKCGLKCGLMTYGGRGGPRGPNLKIKFLCILYPREQELPASFHPIKKYCS